METEKPTRPAFGFAPRPVAPSSRISPPEPVAAPGPEARNDGEILAGIYHHLRELYQAEGGKGVEPLMKMSWNYKQPHEPQSDEVAKENNGYALKAQTMRAALKEQ